VDRGRGLASAATGPQVFTGSSFVLAPWGELAAQAPSFEEALLVCDIDPHAEGPLAHPLVQEVFDRPLFAWGALTLGLHDLCEKTGNNDIAVLLDGSLDSMVVAAPRDRRPRTDEGPCPRPRRC